MSQEISPYKQCQQNDIHTPKNEIILIFGGSGSLGTKLVNRWISHNTIINVSRDEEKQWVLRNSIPNSTNLLQFTGDISNYDDVEYSILHFKPTLIVIAAAMKHIDLCEKYPSKSIQMNVHGIANVQNIIDKNITSVHTVLFVSTDKACAPITLYGHSKAIAESFIQNYQGKVRMIGVRYGNVLNSSGSILPYLRKNKDTKEKQSLTHHDMTRFLMTLDQSVNLIEYALASAQQNEIIIPYLCSMRIQDLFTIFCEKYSKSYEITGLRCKEKIHEDLLSSYESPMSYEKNGYIHLTTSLQANSNIQPFNSSMFNLSKNDLNIFLDSKEYI